MNKEVIYVISICAILLGTTGISAISPKKMVQMNTTSEPMGLVGLWGFNDQNADDASGNEHHGVPIDVNFIDGIFGMGCEIEGDARISGIPDSFDDSIDNQLTLSAWVYLYEAYVDTSYYIFDCREDSWVGGGFILYITQNTNAYFELREVGENQFVRSATNIPVGTWTHVAVVYNHDLGSISIYVNGQLNNVSTTYKPYSQSHYDGCIGNNHWSDGNWRPLHGIIDEVRIYDNALDDHEIANLYENPSGFHNAFIVGRISDISSSGGIITFKAVNVHYVQQGTFTHERYFLGEKIRITNEYKGYLSGAFICALVSTDT